MATAVGIFIAGVGLLFAMAVVPNSSVWVRTLSQASGTADAVALTFDDGPDPVNTPLMLDLLRECGNHTWRHNTELGTYTTDLIEEDLRRTNNAIRAVEPDAPVANFRAPGGIWSANYVAVARALGMALSDSALAARIESLLQRLGLAEYALAPLYSLSGGKRQLVGLALALIREPQLLLLDEPTSALDLHWRMIVLDLVQEKVRMDGAIAVAAIHDLDLAARYCNKLVMLEQGRVVAAGAVADVLTPANIARVFKVEAQIEPGTLGYPLVQVVRPIRHPA